MYELYLNYYAKYKEKIASYSVHDNWAWSDKDGKLDMHSLQDTTGQMGYGNPFGH